MHLLNIVTMNEISAMLSMTSRNDLLKLKTAKRLTATSRARVPVVYSFQIKRGCAATVVFLTVIDVSSTVNELGSTIVIFIPQNESRRHYSQCSVAENAFARQREVETVMKTFFQGSHELRPPISTPG